MNMINKILLLPFICTIIPLVYGAYIVKQVYLLTYNSMYPILYLTFLVVWSIGLFYLLVKMKIITRELIRGRDICKN